MKKITLALLMLLSTQCFAAKNLVEVYVTKNGQLVPSVCNNASSTNNGIPAQTAMTSSYPVTYTYVSQATINIQGFVPYFDDGFTVKENNCPATLPVGSLCTISGEYTPPVLGENRFRFYYKAGTNTFFCNAYTQATQYVGEPNVVYDAVDSQPFKTYYANPEVPNAKYTFRNIGSNRATLGNIQIDGKPTQVGYSVIDNCSGAALNPSQECYMTFGGWLLAGVHQFSITINYDGRQYVYSETIVVGDDNKVMGCKIDA